MKAKEPLNFTCAALVMFVLILSDFAVASTGVTYHGRLMKSDETPVSSGSVTFRVQIRTPGNENCLLYEEQQVKDLSTSKGVFALTIGDGTASVINTEPFALDRVFQNRGTFTFSGGRCVSGSSYAPNPTDGRRIAVEFNDGSFVGWEPIPTQQINFVPMAIETLTVGGFNINNLVRVVDVSGAPAVVSPFTQAQHNSLMDLANGTSMSYLSATSALNGANLANGSVTDAKLATAISGSKISGNITGNAAGFTGSLSGDVTGTQTSTTVSKIQGRAVDSAAPTNGQALVWSGANSRWEPGTISGGGGGGGVSTVTATSGPLTVNNTDPTNPILNIADASGSTKGVVQLTASSADTTAGHVVQANDTRLSDARTPTGTAGGDLDGNYPNPTIAKLQTKDITLTALANGNVLKYDGAKWVNAADSDSLGGLSCSNGDVALYAGGAWSCVAASTTSSNNSIVRRDGTGLITSAGGSFGSLMVNNGTSTITLATPAAFTSYTLKLPSGTGTNGQILTSNGTDMVWSNASSITASNVSGIVAIANGGTGATTASAARTSLGITATGDSLVTAADAAAARTAIGAMANVAGTTAGHVLTANGTAWVSAAPTVNVAGVVSATGTYLTYKPNDVACADGGVLKWNNGASRWECGTDAGSAGTIASITVNAPIVKTGTASDPILSVADASTSAKGAVQLAASTDTTAGLAIQASDSRLAPTPAAGNALNYLRVNTGGTAYEARTAGNVLADIGAMANIAAGTNGNVLTSNGTTWSSTALPVATTGAKGLMQVGTGLAVTSGTVSADFGTAVGKVAQGNDSRFPSATCGSGNKMRWDGTAWQCETDNASDSSKVAKTGDTMSGSLTLSAGTLTAPANGLVVGTNQLVANGGNIGIGTATAQHKVHVEQGDVVYYSTGSSDPLYSFTFAGRRARGTQGSPTAVTAGDLTAMYIGQGYDGTGYQTTGAVMIHADAAPSAGVVPGRLILATANSSGLNTERVRIDSSGRVGIGTTTPRAALDVQGALTGKPATSNATATIDFGAGNLQYTTLACQAFALWNMKDGASYTFAVQNNTSATCSFTAYSGAGTGALTFHLPPDHAATTANKHTVYTFIVLGSHVYSSWIAGY